MDEAGLEQSLLAAAIGDRRAYEVISQHGADELSPLGSEVIKHIGEYYAKDTKARHVDRDALQMSVVLAADDRNRDILQGYLGTVPEVSAPNVVSLLLRLKRQQEGLRLGVMLNKPHIGSEELSEALRDYLDLVQADTLTKPLKVIDDETGDPYDADKVVPLYPSQLNSQTLAGGALPGHHILIFGRTEAGKSLFALNMACGMAYKGHKVLYLGNEEGVAMHRIRAMTNLARIDIREYQERKDEIRGIADERGFGNLIFGEMQPGTFGEIDAWLSEYTPEAVFVDQLSGVHVTEDNPVQAIDKAARAFRTLIQRHNVVGVSVHQAGDRTERHGQLPPAFLTLSDVYMSRTGLPAQTDMMIGIGYDQEMYERDIRGISLPKNKIGGTHNPFKVRIDTQQSRIVSIG